MKLPKFFLCMLLCPFLFGSCNLFDKKDAKVVNSDLLKQPPFVSLTDSIADNRKDAGLYFRRGELLSQANQHELAYKDYQKSWELDPTENAAISYVATMFMVGRTEEATEFLKTCIRRFPENPEFARRLSETYVQTGKSKEALAQYDALLEKDSEDFESWYERGILLAESGDTVNAIKSLERSFALKPLQLSGLALANLYAETKNPNVLMLCDELLKRDTARETTDPVFIKGIYYNNIGQTPKALEQFEECIRRDWKFTEAYIEKGIILFDQKNMDAALKTFQLAATVSNTYADAYYWQGRCYEAIGKKEEAMDNYIRALSLDRSFVEAKRGIDRLKK